MTILISPVNKFGMKPIQIKDTYIFEDKKLQKATTYWEDEDWYGYHKGYGIGEDIEMAIGDADNDSVYCEVFSTIRDDYNYYAELKIGKVYSIYIEDLPELIDFMNYVGPMIKTVIQSDYRSEILSESDNEEIKSWGISV